ncbi:hypothetical protein JCM19314_2112 [Nonlabens ulvanivorans]|uniref:Uncharacterized protein n=1 Tax=Nonlabens ulvanivorans TaxID=906888 RepID=A0A090QFH4_NONUL|nr:hypothetical protein [Nonlabens ulvanivorans]GAL00504.1 hypothetical protein JCM19314_2112 [Nonlabens ulvanivorans]
MTRTVHNENYDLIGRLALALYGQNITITLDALKLILNDHGTTFSDQSNLGLGRSVSAAYRKWEKVDPVIHHAIAYTFKGRDGKFPWENR